MAKKKRTPARRPRIARQSAKRVKRSGPKRPLYKESPRKPATPPVSRAKRRDTPADWYTSLGANLPTADRARKRREVLGYLTEAVRGRPGKPATTGGAREPGLRDIFKGFTAREGFDLRHPERWTKGMHDKVQGLAKYLHNLTSQPFKVVTPKTLAQRKTLRHFTAQEDPQQRAYVVHVPSPLYRVKLRKEKKKKTVGLSLETPARFGGFGKLKYFLFRDYTANGQPPVLPEDFYEATRRMQEQLPDWAYMSIWSQPHGIISSPQPRNSMVRKLQEWFTTGDSFGGEKFGVAQDILLGWVLQGTEEDAETTLRARLKRRRPRNRWADRQRQLRRKAMKLPPLPK